MDGPIANIGNKTSDRGKSLYQIPNPYNILLDIVLATDVKKYSLASASCQPIWRTLVGEQYIFLAVAKDCGIGVYLNQSQQSISPCFG